jgi:hypothetical protein
MRNYYLMSLADEADAWSLAVLDSFGDGTPVDVWAYNQCKLIADPRPVPLKIQVEGRRLDFNPTAFSATVVSHRMAEALERVSPNEIQRIPAIVEGETDNWEVINILPCPDCIDHKASLIQYFPASHATKARKPRGILRLVIDPCTENCHVFHPKDWRVATIVSQAAKDALEDVGATGVEYMPVT